MAADEILILVREIVEGVEVEVIVAAVVGVVVGFIARRQANTATNVTSTKTANCSVISTAGSEICRKTVNSIKNSLNHTMVNNGSGN